MQHYTIYNQKPIKDGKINNSIRPDEINIKHLKYIGFAIPQTIILNYSEHQQHTTRVETDPTSQIFIPIYTIYNICRSTSLLETVIYKNVFTVMPPQYPHLH